jgi:hypothetical protein
MYDYLLIGKNIFVDSKVFPGLKIQRKMLHFVLLVIYLQENQQEC